MDAAELAVIGLAIFGLVACVVALTICIVSLSTRVAVSLRRMTEHALAESEAQRDILRTRLQTDHQEFLLREAREKERLAAQTNGWLPRKQHVEGEPDINVNLEDAATLN